MIFITFYILSILNLCLSGSLDINVTNSSVSEILSSNPALSIFKHALDADPYTSLVVNSSNTTVFAPTNASFSELPPFVLFPFAISPFLRSVALSYHVINATLPSSFTANFTGEIELPTALGLNVTLSMKNGSMVLNNISRVMSITKGKNGAVVVIDSPLDIFYDKNNGSNALGKRGDPYRVHGGNVYPGPNWNYGPARPNPWGHPWRSHPWGNPWRNPWGNPWRNHPWRNHPWRNHPGNYPDPLWNARN